jgi:hypothetical protein
MPASTSASWDSKPGFDQIRGRIGGRGFLFSADQLPEPERASPLLIWPLVKIELISLGTARRMRIESKTLCKILHLVGFHGWQPERLSSPAPSATWETQIIVPHINPYLSGVVSEADAAGLSAGLQNMIAAEGLGLAPEIHYAALAVLAIAKCGPFDVCPDLDPLFAQTPSEQATA